MAEKEERILIGTDIESPCVKCKVELCTEMCEEYEKFEKEFKPSALKVFSRQEAIEKIDYVLQDFGIRKNDWEIAEAALNALLSSGEPND